MCCVRRRRQRFAHFGGFFNWIIFFFSEALIGIRRKNLHNLYFMCSPCCLFYPLLCLSAAALCSSVCFYSLCFAKTAVKSNLLSSISPWQAERTMKQLKTWQRAAWPSVRHPQIGLCWSYTSPVQEGSCRIFSVFISPVSNGCLPLDAPPPPACQSLPCADLGGRQQRHFHVKLACAENRNINKNMYGQPLSKRCINKWLPVQPSEA